MICLGYLERKPAGSKVKIESQDPVVVVITNKYKRKKNPGQSRDQVEETGTI
jgi:hypothetical protein